MWFLIFSGLIVYTGKPVSCFCPIEMSPSSAVVKFGGPFSANCSSLSNLVEEMGWESSNGGVTLTENVSYVSINISSVTDWGFEPMCFINHFGGDQCAENLPVTVYKMPDSVSMSPPSQMGPMVEGEKYLMQCDVVNVAPVRNVTVHWHKGNKIFSTATFDDVSVTPVSLSSVVNLTVHGSDNGTQIWCEAKLNFLSTNLPSIQSKSHEVIVLYPPTFINPAIEVLELPSRGEITLNCTATGNPMPVYSWRFPHAIQVTNENQDRNQAILTPTIQLPGTYNCTASNSQGTKTKSFTVIEATSSHPGTTAGILMAVFFVLIFISGCVVYHKQRNASVETPQV